MAVSNIPSGSDCGVNPKAEVQPRRGDDRPERVAGHSVKLNGNRYQSRRVSSHSEPGCRTADKHKSQGEGRRKRRFQSPSSLTPEKRFYHDNERVADVHDRKGNPKQITGRNSSEIKQYSGGRRYHDNERVADVHDRKGNLKQITGRNSCVIKQYIQEKKKCTMLLR